MRAYNLLYFFENRSQCGECERSNCTKSASRTSMKGLVGDLRSLKDKMWKSEQKIFYEFHFAYTALTVCEATKL